MNIIIIRVSYQLKTLDFPIVRELTPEEYFYPYRECKYDNEILIDNLDLLNAKIDYAEIIWSEIRISGLAAVDTVIKTNYYNNGKSRITHRKYPAYEEIQFIRETDSGLFKVIKTPIKRTHLIWSNQTLPVAAYYLNGKPERPRKLFVVK